MLACPIVVVMYAARPTKYPEKCPQLHACPSLGKVIVSADVQLDQSGKQPIVRE
jgi:hypothetical protein